LHMFKDDFEFADGATPSHLHATSKQPSPSSVSAGASSAAMRGDRVGATLATDTTRDADVDDARDAPAAANAVAATEEESALGESSDGVVAAIAASAVWLAPAEAELRKIPFFVRGKARRNTERYAMDHGITQITVETLYEAKAHHGR